VNPEINQTGFESYEEIILLNRYTIKIEKSLA